MSCDVEFKDASTCRLIDCNFDKDKEYFDIVVPEKRALDQEFEAAVRLKLKDSGTGVLSIHTTEGYVLLDENNITLVFEENKEAEHIFRVKPIMEGGWTFKATFDTGKRKIETLRYAGISDGEPYPPDLP
jgi:hypothetical protein